MLNHFSQPSYPTYPHLPPLTPLTPTYPIYPTCSESLFFLSHRTCLIRVAHCSCKKTRIYMLSFTTMKLSEKLCFMTFVCRMRGVECYCLHIPTSLPVIAAFVFLFLEAGLIPSPVAPKRITPKNEKLSHRPSVHRASTLVTTPPGLLNVSIITRIFHYVLKT